MTNLYPFKFTPILKEKIWGGDSLVSRWGKPGTKDVKIGESWEISGLQGDQSVLANGFLEGNNIGELLEVYMGDLVGEDIYEKFGNEFPLLIKFIDARELLSIQVHPDDSLALEKHSSYGKTEMWYILDSGKESTVYSGFKDEITKEDFVKRLASENIPELLNKINPLPGDSFFIPAGTIHCFGKDMVLIEIQQTSDITYRVFDWGRVDASGKSRDLHTELALDAIDFSKSWKPADHFDSLPNLPVKVAECNYFNVNLINTKGRITMDYSLTDSFIIYICLSGSMEIKTEGTSVNITMGETILIPAITNFVDIIAPNESELLEIYIEPKTINQKLS